MDFECVLYFELGVHWSVFWTKSALECILYLECIGVYFAAGDRFLTETNISQANPATTIHPLQKCVKCFSEYIRFSQFSVSVRVK